METIWNSAENSWEYLDRDWKCLSYAEVTNQMRSWGHTSASPPLTREDLLGFYKCVQYKWISTPFPPTGGIQKSFMQHDTVACSTKHV